MARRILPIVLASCVCAVSASAETTQTGRALYAASCASCHGADGRGTGAVLSNYPRVPPDLTDCNFTTREPNSDWLAVAHRGGNARGFDRLMPSFGEVLQEDELLRILDHVRTFCEDPAWPRGELNLPRAQVTSKAYPEDEAAVRVIGERTRVTTRLVYARRIGARHQIEAIVPFVYLDQPAGDWAGGIGDIALSVKRVLWHSLASGSIASAAVEIVTPTGRTDRGIGAGTTLFEGYAAYGQVLPARAFMQLQIGGGVPYDQDRAASEVFARGVIGWRWIPSRFGRQWSPMVELLGARELVDSATTHVDVLPQLQVTLSARQHIVANIGVRLPVNEREGRATQVLAYLIWDWFDGSILEGW